MPVYDVEGYSLKEGDLVWFARNAVLVKGRVYRLRARNRVYVRRLHDQAEIIREGRSCLFISRPVVVERMQKDLVIETKEENGRGHERNVDIYQRVVVERERLKWVSESYNLSMERVRQISLHHGYTVHGGVYTLQQLRRLEDKKRDAEMVP